MQVYGEDADYFSEQPHYTLVCDAREVEMEEEEVQYVSQGEIVRVEDRATRIVSAYVDQGCIPSVTPRAHPIARLPIPRSIYVNISGLTQTT